MRKIFISLILLMFASILSAQNSSYTETISFADSNIAGTDSVYRFSAKSRADCFQKYVVVKLIVHNLDALDATFSWGGGDDNISRDFSVVDYEYVPSSSGSFPYTVDTTNTTGTDPIAQCIGSAGDTVYIKRWYIDRAPFHRAAFKWSKGSTTTGNIRVDLEVGKTDN